METVTDEMVEAFMAEIFEWQPALQTILDFEATKVALQSAVELLHRNS